MMGFKKCGVCMLMCDEEKLQKHENKLLCPTCFEEYGKEAQHRRELVDFFYRYFLGEDPAQIPLLNRKINYILREYREAGENMSSLKMLNALKYIYFYREDPPELLIDYWDINFKKFYSEAKNFYKSIEQCNSQSDDYIRETLSKKPKQIIIKRSDLNRDEVESNYGYLKNYAEKFDIDDIDSDGDFEERRDARELKEERKKKNDTSKNDETIKDKEVVIDFSEYLDFIKGSDNE